MLNSATAKTKLAPKRSLAYVVMMVALAATIFGVLALPHHSATSRIVKMGATNYELEIASTDSAREQGLSERTSMPNDHGMIFEYQHQNIPCYWMKGMRFSLDIIWVNNSHQVVYVEHNVSPQTYPRTFCPNQPAQYVIELNAGQARTIHTGQMLQL